MFRSGWCACKLSCALFNVRSSESAMKLIFEKSIICFLVPNKYFRQLEIGRTHLISGGTVVKCIF